MTDVVNVFFSTYIYSYDIGFSPVNDWSFCWFNLNCRWSGGSCLPFATTRSAVSLSTSREPWEMMKKKNSFHFIKPRRWWWTIIVFTRCSSSCPAFPVTLRLYAAESPSVLPSSQISENDKYVLLISKATYVRYRKCLSVRHIFHLLNKHLLSCYFIILLDHNDPLKPSHRLTNGPESSKTIESDGSNIKKPS